MELRPYQRSINGDRIEDDVSRGARDDPERPRGRINGDRIEDDVSHWFRTDPVTGKRRINGDRIEDDVSPLRPARLKPSLGGINGDRIEDDVSRRQPSLAFEWRFGASMAIGSRTMCHDVTLSDLQRRDCGHQWRSDRGRCVTASMAIGSRTMCHASKDGGKVKTKNMTRYILLSPRNEVVGDVDLAEHAVEAHESMLGAKAYLPIDLDYDASVRFGVIAAELGMTKAELFREWIAEHWVARAEAMADRIAC